MTIKHLLRPQWTLASGHKAPTYRLHLGQQPAASASVYWVKYIALFPDCQSELMMAISVQEDWQNSDHIFFFKKKGLFEKFLRVTFDPKYTDTDTAVLVKEKMHKLVKIINKIYYYQTKKINQLFGRV